LTFDRLPLVWQKENADAGKVAIELLYEKVLNGESFDGEELASKVHDAWLSRPNNSWAIEYQTEESKPYEKLPEHIKAKDRRHIVLANEVLRRVKEGSITYENLKNEIGSAMTKFNTQITQIQGECR
jgi:hypothetical protein